MRVKPTMRAAPAPPEAREGADRAEVKLMVSGSDIEHTRFVAIVDHLREGDLLVVNTSATMPAAIEARRGSDPMVVHVSTPMPDGSWVIELRQPSQTGPILDARPGDTIRVAGGRTLELDVSADMVGRPDHTRLWKTAAMKFDLGRHLARHGHPIRYDYVPDPWPLSHYQTVFSRPTAEFGSAEMASAARPFTLATVAALTQRAVRIAPIVLHAGVASLEVGEAPSPERYLVSRRTSDAVRETGRRGGRVIAVGTTVTRALETAARGNHMVGPASGWTDLVLDAHNPARIVDGILTGWHPPEASHLALLEGVVGRERVARVYAAADGHDYLLHEFGDACLILPEG